MKSFAGNKTQFIREQFLADPGTTLQEMLSRWRQFSSEELNPTLYYQVKKTLQIHNRGAMAPKPAVENPYFALERSLDELSERAAELSDVELCRTFRLCRHHCSLQLLPKSS